MLENKPRKSGWEYANEAAHGAGKAVEGVDLIIMKLYALVLLIVGVVVLVAAFSTG